MESLIVVQCKFVDIWYSLAIAEYVPAYPDIPLWRWDPAHHDGVCLCAGSQGRRLTWHCGFYNT